MCLRFVSTIVWSLSTICCQVCEFVQTLIEKQIVWSHKKVFSYFHVKTKFQSKFSKSTYTQNPNLELERLLPSLSNSIVVAQIFTYLPLTPLMFWCFHRGNTSWFGIVGEIVPWNTLEVVRINHKSYLQQILWLMVPQGNRSKCTWVWTSMCEGVFTTYWPNFLHFLWFKVWLFWWHLECLLNPMVDPCCKWHLFCIILNGHNIIWIESIIIYICFQFSCFQCDWIESISVFNCFKVGCF